jgi:putative transposase
MPRKLRFAPPDHFLHITQRGNYRQRTFFCDMDRYTTFLNILGEHAIERHVEILAYCLMPNHYHLVAIGRQENSIVQFMQGLNGQYARYLHHRLDRRGRFWQDRYFSCVLDSNHLTNALRYVELNPVRSRAVKQPQAYHWSSAKAHCELATNPLRIVPDWLNTSIFHELYGELNWRLLLAQGQGRQEEYEVRHATYREVPLADSKFVEALEREFQRSLRYRPPGRPKIAMAA